MKSKVEKKLFRLFTGEFTALFLFALIWIYSVPGFAGATDYFISNTAIFILLELILLQGSVYWYLKWRRVRKRLSFNLEKEELRPFVICKRINTLLFFMIALYFVYNYIQSPGGNVFYFIVLFLFALIEHINYYYVRLSYMHPEEIEEFRKQKGFRKSILAREIERM